MIPRIMESFLRERLTQATWENRLVQEDGMCFMEFGATDMERQLRLGVHLGSLGPRLVACMWDSESPLEVGGYLVVDNLAMGRPSLGGIRMAPDLTPAEVNNLARGMTLKNAAANLPFGGGKAGLVADRHLPPEEHTEVMRRFARMLYRYRDLFLPGPDVGTNDADMKTIAIENGLDTVVSKPFDMGGSRNDQLGAAGGGLVIALQALLAELPRLKALSQFAGLASSLPDSQELTVILQGFGSVGSHAARILLERIPGARVVGVSDSQGYLYDPLGLPIERLFQIHQQGKSVTRQYFKEAILSAASASSRRPKFSTSPDDLLREDAFCLIPAAPIAHYLDTDLATQPAQTVDHMGTWAVIVEGANTYSPDPLRKTARARMERAVYRQRGVLIATDYLVNSGAVIFAAQEQLIKTPNHLRIPDEMLGKREAVDRWLADHAEDLQALSEKRRLAAEQAREEVIRRNMHELVDQLISNPDLLPGEAAERISLQRITLRERGRTAADIMETILTIPVKSSIREAARLLSEAGSPLIAVVSSQDALLGVITDWDITRAMAQGLADDTSLDKIMTRHVITAAPADSLLDLVRKLEYHEISALPVVQGGVVLGMVSTDLLSRRSLYRLLQTQGR